MESNMQMPTSNRTFLSLVRRLMRHSKPILIPGDNVKILYSPDQFFNTLKDGVQRANHRVILSSLYLGTQKREQELVNLLGDSLTDKPNLRCSFLLDYLRGSRGFPNSRSMVQSLIHNHGDRFKLHLYHTPNLRGLLKSIGPERFNEVMGLQHMKIYIFDDDLILSGANLSRDYFVDRQDRYTWFKNCPHLADFFAELVEITASHSFTLKQDGTTEKPAGVQVDPLSSKTAAKNFKTSMNKAVLDLIQRKHVPPKTDNLKLDTAVFPLVQMGCYGVQQDEVVTEEIFHSLKEGERLCLASGYFNLPPQYVDAILKGKGEYNILAASPQANGFYGGKGVAGHVPVMYIHFAKKFLEKVSSNGCQQRVSYLEYYREGWTYHGKGLWHYPVGESLPMLSLMGSSNYGHRSLTRDLEAQVALVTTNQDLRKSLHEEMTKMYNYGQVLTLDDVSKDKSRKLTFLEWIATNLLKPHV